MTTVSNPPAGTAGAGKPDMTPPDRGRSLFRFAEHDERTGVDLDRVLIGDVPFEAVGVEDRGFGDCRDGGLD